MLRLRVSSAFLQLVGLGVVFTLPVSFQARAQSATPGTSAKAQVEFLPPPPMRYVPGMEEPLIAMGTTSESENVALASAISAYNARASVDDFRSLEEFVSQHPNSAWNVAVETNLGFLYYHYGYFSKAIDAWEVAWRDGRSANDPKAKPLVDRAVGELARMHSRLGHVERLESLFAEIGDRHVTGAATEALTGAREGLWVMHNRPGNAYLCGPNGLRNLLISLHSLSKEDSRILENYQSGPHGVTLSQLSNLADRVKLPHRVVYRSEREPVPIPSIIHWKVNHFAALIGYENGRYHLADPTFGDDLWITESALKEESSGYYIVPDGQTYAWRDAQPEEQSRIYGAGITSTNDPLSTLLFGDICVECIMKGLSTALETDSATTPDSPTNGGMAGYTMHEMVVSLHITDTPVGYAPPKGYGVYTTIVYNQREANQPATFTYFNLSPKWTMNWLSYIQDDPNYPGSTVSRYAGGGGTVTYVGYTGGLTGSFTPETRDASVLRRVVDEKGNVSYQRQLASGGAELYAESNGATSYPRQIFLTQLIDPQGNKNTLNYDSQLRLTSITDATGRDTKFSYGLAPEPLLVTAITDPFGRKTEIEYDASGRLTQITDTLGIKSKFSYDASSLVNAMTTPYGTTTFIYGDNGNQRYLQATDPLGYTERLEFLQYAPGIPYNDPPNTIPTGINPFNAYLYGRDTYYWDKHAYAIGAGDYTKARNRHWTHEASNNSVTNHTVESIKYPLESRIWIGYPGESDTGFSGTYDKPNIFGRVLDDGSSQVYQKTYNPQGNETDSIDPVLRETQTTYAANGIDPITVQQRTSATGLSTTAQYKYNTQHLPLTYTDAAGKTTDYQYNSAGQITQVTDALGETTKYNYDTLGYLTSVINANGKTQSSYTYDTEGRVATATDSEDYTVEYSYDPMNRVTKETFPDGTSRDYAYTNLDLTSVTDRQGNTTKYQYDAVRNLVETTDPLGHTTKYGYFENRSLKSQTDPNGNATLWTIDLEDRVTGKQYADGSQVTNSYEGTNSRLHSVTDALKQVKTTTYAVDDMLTGITYTNSVHTTPNVTFTYDPYFFRVASMTDGTGTTIYAYQPIGAPGALQLASETGPFKNATIGYTYDALSRLASRTVDTSTETYAYDKLSRLITDHNELGNFSLSYLGQTGQMTSQSSNANVGTQWSYEPNINDRRLKSIVNQGGGRSFAFETTPENLITSIQNLPATDKSGTYHDGQPAWQYTYDDDYRVSRATPPAGLGDDAIYDAADNLVGGTRQGQPGTGTYNDLNQLTAIKGATLVYDAAGNLTDDGYSKTFEWDAENRLIQITHKDNAAITTAFSYDGLGRRVAMTNAGGTAAQAFHYLWCGEQLCQSRTATDAVSRHYYSQGEFLKASQVGLYYGYDQLGSVRDALSSFTGLSLASTDYDPAGLVLASTGSTQTDLGYAGMFTDSQDGLYLTHYRAYDPVIGRWLSRDLIGETTRPNLYTYANENPVNTVDPTGLIANPLEISCLDPLQPFCWVGVVGDIGSDIWAIYKTLNTIETVVQMTAPGNVADSGIERLVSQLQSAAVLSGQKRPDRCDVLQDLIDNGEITELQAKATKKQWGCRSSRQSKDKCK